MKNVVLVLSLFISVNVLAQESYSPGDIVFGTAEAPEFVLTESDACYETIKDLLYSNERLSTVLETLEECESDGADYLTELIEGCGCIYPLDPFLLTWLVTTLESNAIFCCCIQENGAECWSAVPKTCEHCECDGGL